jgi:hypothetical protein
MGLSTIVKDSDLDDIRDKLKQLDVADKELELLRRAGVDTAEAQKQSASARDSLLKLRNTYFPGQV